MLRRRGRRFMLASVLALAWQFAPAQLEDVPDTKVTVSFPPIRLERLLPLIAAKAGLTLTSSNQLHDEVLVLVATDTSMREILQKIASVTNTTWRATREGLILERSLANE